MDDDDYEYIDENHRVGIEQDEFVSNDPPTGWGNVVVVPFPRSRWTYRQDDKIDKVIGDDWIDLESAVERFADAWGNGYSYGESEKAQEATIRWAKLFHNRTVIFDDTTDAFWYLPKTNLPSEWSQKWLDNHFGGDAVSAERTVIEGEIQQYRQWAEGEVYVVFAQERHVEHITVTNPETNEVVREYDRETWDTEDSVGGVYLTYRASGNQIRKEALETARDYFDSKYTKKEEVK